MIIKNPGDTSNSMETSAVPEVMLENKPTTPPVSDTKSLTPPPAPPVESSEANILSPVVEMIDEPEDSSTRSLYRGKRPGGLSLSFAPHFLESKKSKLIAVCVFLGLVAIFAVAGLIFNNAGSPGSMTSPVKSGDTSKNELSGSSTMSTSAKVGDSFVASIPTVGGDRQVTVTATVKRIIKLMPENGGGFISLKFCNENGCHPMQPVQVGADEALVAVDLDLYNPSTELDTVGANSAYIMAQYLRFKVGENYESVKTMALDIFNNRWFEQEPTFYISPSKRITMTFFTRVPAATEKIDFSYGPDIKKPLFRIPLTFEVKGKISDEKMPPASAVNEEDALQKQLEESDAQIDKMMASTISAKGFKPYGSQIDKREPLTCTFTGTSQEGVLSNRTLAIDGERYSYKTQSTVGTATGSVSEVFDGKRVVYYLSSLNAANGGVNQDQIIDVIDLSCFKHNGQYPSIRGFDFKDPVENVSCRSGAESMFVPPYDESQVKSVGNGC